MAQRALLHLAQQIDEQHREGMRTIEDDLGELHFGGAPALVESRRRFAQRVAAGGAISFGAIAIPIAAMVPAGQAQTPTSPPAGSTPPGTAGTTSLAEPKLADADLQLAIFAQTVELAVVALYRAAIAKPILPRSIAEVLELFAGHHGDHAAQFGAFAGKAAVGRPNPTLLAELTPKLDAAATAKQILELARGLEEGAAATYVYALGLLGSREAAAAVSTILPIESQHSVALSFAIDGSDVAFLEHASRNVPNFETEASLIDPTKHPVG